MSEGFIFLIGGVQVFKKLRPDYFFTTVYEIPMEFYLERHITHLFVDLDNTLTGDEDREQPAHFSAWLEQINTAGITLVIVSNNKRADRVEEFVGTLPIEWYHDAHKQDGVLFNELLRKHALSSDNVAVIGDRILTDVVGGKRINALTILTAAITADKHPLIKYVRAVEGLIRPIHQ